jgi:hypothetical protein
MANPVSHDPDVAALAAAIKSAPMPKGVSASDFCKIWEQVKPLLPLLQTAAALIPVIGAAISAAIGLLTKLGDAAAAALCGSK